MPLDKRQIETLLAAVSGTRDDEIDCGDCLAGMAEFAERELLGADVPAALRRIREHLATCPECSEEYEVLLEVVRGAALDPPP